MSTSQESNAIYYIVAVDNSSGALSDVMNWTDDDSGALSCIGKSFSVLSADEYKGFALSQWADEVFVKTRMLIPRSGHVRSDDVPTMAQMKHARQVMESIGVAPGGECEHDLLSMIVDEFPLQAALINNMKRRLKNARFIAHQKSDDEERGDDSRAGPVAPEYTVVEGVLDHRYRVRFAPNEKPLYASPNLAKTSQPLTNFFAPAAPLPEANDVEKPADFAD